MNREELEKLPYKKVQKIAKEVEKKSGVNLKLNGKKTALIDYVLLYTKEEEKNVAPTEPEKGKTEVVAVKEEEPKPEKPTAIREWVILSKRISPKKNWPLFLRVAKKNKYWRKKKEFFEWVDKNKLGWR